MLETARGTQKAAETCFHLYRAEEGPTNPALWDILAPWISISNTGLHGALDIKVNQSHIRTLAFQVFRR